MSLPSFQEKVCLSENDELIYNSVTIKRIENWLIKKRILSLPFLVPSKELKKSIYHTMLTVYNFKTMKERLKITTISMVYL